MAILIDLSGKQFGLWRVLRRSDSDISGKPAWVCVCSCGAEREVYGGNLRLGKSISCGCDRDKKTVGRNRNRAKHGGRGTTEYRIWMGAKTRCFNAQSPNYKHYGGRGITMCEAWVSDFTRFLLDVGPRPGVAYTLDRVNNNGDYEPNNVRWATKKEQANNMRVNLLITHGGRTQTLSMWAEETGVPYETLRWRHKHGKDLT
jgi:hypothetical protein